MARHPFQGLPSPFVVPLFVAAVAGAGVLGFLALRHDRQLRTEAAPLGIVSLELASSSDRAEEILQSWDEDAMGHAQSLQRLDYPFLVSYTVALSLAAAGAGELFRDQVLVSLLAPFTAWSAVGAGLLDIVENLALEKVLAGRVSGPWTELSAVAAGIKFVLLLGVITFLILSLITYSIGRLTSA